MMRAPQWIDLSARNRESDRMCRRHAGVSSTQHVPLANGINDTASRSGRLPGAIDNNKSTAVEPGHFLALKVSAFFLLCAGCAVQPIGREAGIFSPAIFEVEYWECGSEVHACGVATGPPAGIEGCELVADDTTHRRPRNCQR